jgi:transposase-like protein
MGGCGYSGRTRRCLILFVGLRLSKKKLDNSDFSWRRHFSIFEQEKL